MFSFVCPTENVRQKQALIVGAFERGRSLWFQILSIISDYSDNQISRF